MGSFRDYLVLCSCFTDEETQAKRVQNVKTNRRNKTPGSRTSLVAQWLRICLPMQGTWARALVRENATCCGATKPVCHNY